MSKRIYIDSNCTLGRTNIRDEKIPYSLDMLMEDMEYYGINKALVSSQEAREYSFTKGNRLVIEHSEKNTRIHTVAVVVPGVEYELKEGFDYFSWLLDNGVNAFRFYPKQLRHGFAPGYMEKTAEFMINHRVPLIIDISETDYSELSMMLESFPDLDILLCRTYWSDERYLFPLMDKYRNLHFEISSNQANEILYSCKKHFGLDRVLYGSDYPNKSIGAIKALIEYADITEAEKDMVAWENASRLFSIEPADILSYPADVNRLDKIALSVDQGRALDDILVIDSHTHMVDINDQTVSRSQMLYGDEDSIIRKMDRMGVDCILTTPWEGITTNGIAANETSRNAALKYPGRIIPYAACNPNYEEDLDAVIDIYHKKYGFIGIKPYPPLHNYDLLGEKYSSWFEYGDKNKLFMLVHSEGQKTAEKIEILAKKYPDLIFIMAHTGISHEYVRINSDLAKKNANVYLEITYTAVTNNAIEHMVKQVGPDRVLYGSDLPMRDPAPQLAWVAYARISVEDKIKILGKNMKKIIDRCYK